MGKIHFIIQEFLRSFKNSILKDMLLIIMITISVIMTVIMASYYLDLNENESVSHNMDNATWYETGLDDLGEFYQELSSVTGCKRVLEYIEEISLYENYPMYFFETQQSMFLDCNKTKSIIGSDKCDSFFTRDHPVSFSAIVAGEPTTLIDLKSIHVDHNAYKMFGLKTIYGEGITEENTYLNNPKEEIPIVLGYDYTGILDIGDKIELIILDYIYPCKVVGILEEGLTCPEYGDNIGEFLDLDTYIIFPAGIHFKNLSGTVYDLDKYAFWNTVSLYNGSYVAIEGKEDMTNLTYDYKSIADKYNLSPMRIEGASLGLNLLSNESKESVRILCFLTIILIVFTVYSLLTAIYDRIRANIRVYSIYLMNGSSVFYILIPYIIEIIIMVFPSIIVSRYIFKGYKLGYFSENINLILITVYLSVALIVLVSTLCSAYFMKKIDIEQYIRQED